MSFYMTGGLQRVVWNGQISGQQAIKYGVRQGSILGPLLFLVMVSDMEEIISGVPGAALMSYADDTTVWASAKNIDVLKVRLDSLAEKFVAYTAQAGLVLNADKTQLMVITPKNRPTQSCTISVASEIITPSDYLEILGLKYNKSINTSPYWADLAKAARTRLGLINRLSYIVPRKLLRVFTHGLLLGKISYAAAAAFPLRLTEEDPSLPGVLQEIQKSINAAARAITGKRLMDRCSTKDILSMAKLPTLNNIVAKATASEAWTSRAFGGPVGDILFGAATKRNT